MITQIIDLDLVPKQNIPPRVKVSQYDKDSRDIQCHIYNGNVPFIIPSGSVVIQGTKKDKTGFQYPCTFSGNVVTFSIEQQMTIFAGELPVELVFTANEQQLGSANFIIDVEEAPLKEDTIISETDLPLIEEALEALPEVISYRDQAMASATEAAGSANSASISATNAAESATSANTAKDTATTAATTATAQATTATNAASAASLSATNAANSATAAETDAGRASQSATAAAASATAAENSANDAALSESIASNVRTDIQGMYSDITAKLEIAQFYVGDDGNLYYDGGSYIFTVDNDGYLLWEVAV